MARAGFSLCQPSWAARMMSLVCSPSAERPAPPFRKAQKCPVSHSPEPLAGNESQRETDGTPMQCQCPGYQECIIPQSQTVHHQGSDCCPNLTSEARVLANSAQFVANQVHSAMVSTSGGPGNNWAFGRFEGAMDPIGTRELLTSFNIHWLPGIAPVSVWTGALTAGNI